MRTLARSAWLALVFLSVLALPAPAQATLAWEGLHDGTTATDQCTSVESIAAHPGGGVVASCRAYWFYAWPMDYWAPVSTQVVRWSASGQKLWSTVIVPWTFNSGTTPVHVDAQGNTYVAVPHQASNQWNSDLFALDSNGTILWVAQVPNAMISSIAHSPSGDLVITGMTNAPNSKILVSAFSPLNGSPLWNIAVGGLWVWESSARGIRVAFDSTGEIFVLGQLGYGPNPSRQAIATLKLSPSGQLRWTRVVPSPVLGSAGAGTMAVTPSDELVIGGSVQTVLSSTNVPGAAEAYVECLDSNGQLRWRHGYAPTPASFPLVKEVKVPADGSTWAVWSGDGIMGLLHYGADGSVLAEIAHDPPGLETTMPLGIDVGAAGQVWVGAYRFSSPGNQWWNGTPQALVMQFDHEGGLDWSRTFRAPSSHAKESYGAVAFTPQKEVVLAGMTGWEPRELGLVLSIDISAAPDAYCSSQVNSLGCFPAMEFTGSSSASATAGFTVRCTRVINRKLGLLLYSVRGSAATPFHGGTLCLSAPVLRTGMHASGGSPYPANDCSGAYSLDVNAFAHGTLGGTPSPVLLIPGTRVWMQAWAVDPGYAFPNGTSLSNGLTFLVLP